MKRRRLLLFTLSVILALCAACGLWLYRERQQYAHNRALIDALTHYDMKNALVLVNAGADSNTRQQAPPAPTLPQLPEQFLHHTPPPANDSPTAFILACIWDVKTTASTSHSAVSEEAHLALLRAMLSHGANINARYSGMETALNYAVHFQNPRIVELLLQHGADANIPDPIGITPLESAAVDDVTKVHLLLAHGADSNAPNGNGNTVLSSAMYYSNPEAIIPELLAHGADPNLPNKEGTTPLQIAQQANRPDLVRLLKHGAK